MTCTRYVQRDRYTTQAGPGRVVQGTSRGLGEFGGLSAGKAADRQTCAQTCGGGAGQGLTGGRRELMYFHAVGTKAGTGGKARRL